MINTLFAAAAAKESEAFSTLCELPPDGWQFVFLVLHILDTHNGDIAHGDA